MKWRVNYNGDTRIVRRFLWWPVSINRDGRWLEWATVEQKFHSYGRFWSDERWVD